MNVFLVNAQTDTNKCIPNCRLGFTCINGTCISSCNPPCPENYICAEAKGCISLEKNEDLLDSQFGKVFLSTSLTMAGIIISVAAFSISENNEYRISKNDLLGFRICGPSLLAVSIPLNIISWRKWKESYLYKKSTEKQIQ